MTASPMPLCPDRPTNVIWVLCDQLRVQSLGYRGCTEVHTPNIDNLARQSQRFDCAVAGAPWCCPFRGALLSGRYPHQNGVTSTPVALDPGLPTIAAPFKEAGWHTAWIGKWHLDGSNSRDHLVPAERRGGFDHWLGYENNNNQHECYVHGSGHEAPVRLDGFETDALTDLLIDHLDEHVGGARDDDDGYQPFFACLSVQPPHGPYTGPTNPPHPRSHRNPGTITLRPNVPPLPWVQDRSRLDTCGYYDLIENIDWNLGRLSEALRRLGVDRETFVIFFSDHGDMLGSHGQYGKSSPWEESIRVPFLVGKVGGGDNMRIGRSDAPVNHVDIAPTTLGLCGIARPGWMVGHDYSSRCLRPTDRGFRAEADPATEPDAAYLQQIPAKQHAHSVNTPWRGVLMRDGWKYVVTPRGDWLLHDTARDPCEQANLVYDHAFADQRRRCLERLRRFVVETGDEFPLPAE